MELNVQKAIRKLHISAENCTFGRGFIRAATTGLGADFQFACVA